MLADTRQRNYNVVRRLIAENDEVDIKRQKPEPDGVLACLDELTALAPGHALYIGDHETDVRCARKAQRTLAAHAGPAGWSHQPDYVAWSPREVLEIADAVSARPAP